MRTMGHGSMYFALACCLLLLQVFPKCRTNQGLVAQWDDATITASVRARFLNDSALSPLNVAIRTDEGEVFLIGRVLDYQTRLRAESYARKVDAVWSVVNQIRVGQLRERPGYSDFDIKNRVEARFVREPDIPSLNIEVVSFEGTVYLLGRVPEERTRMLAEEIAMGQVGVLAVENFLKVGEIGAGN